MPWLHSLHTDTNSLLPVWHWVGWNWAISLLLCFHHHIFCVGSICCLTWLSLCVNASADWTNVNHLWASWPLLCWDKGENTHVCNLFKLPFRATQLYIQLSLQMWMLSYTCFGLLIVCQKNSYKWYLWKIMTQVLFFSSSKNCMLLLAQNPYKHLYEHAVLKAVTPKKP